MSTGKELQTVKSLLRREDYQNRFKEILGQRAAQFSASVVNVSRDQNIAACDPASVIAAAIVAATLDLPVDKNLGFAWIVPYKQVASFQMGYKGYVQLALRSGQYSRMNAKPINKEAFGGYDDVGEPRILWDKVDERQPPVGYAFAWKLVGGFSKTCYWPKERVEAHARQYSQSYRGGYQSPWKTHFDQMALKTVIKNELSDWGILSIDMQRAMKHDQGAQADLESDVVYVDNEATPIEATVKPADLSDLPPTRKPLSTEAQAASTVTRTPDGLVVGTPAAAPTAAATQPEAPKATETPAKAPESNPDGDTGPVCAHCGQPTSAGHTCPGLEAAIAKTQETRTGTPAEQEAQENAERKELLGSIGLVMEQNGVTLPQLLRYCDANKVLKVKQKLTDASNPKLKLINKGLMNPATIAEVKKFPAE